MRYIDTKYSSDRAGMLKGEYVFNGYTDSKISRVTPSTASAAPSPTTQWRMELLSDPAFSATTTVADGFPLGTQTFTMEGKNISFQVNLNACDDDHQFNCRDGTCVHIKERYERRVRRL